MSMDCKYGGPCSGCMACQDDRFYDPVDEPEEGEDDAEADI